MDVDVEWESTGGYGMDWDEMSWDEYLDDNDNEYAWGRGKGS